MSTRLAKRTLPKITWDQATVLQLATTRGLTALGYSEHQLRRWSAAGIIHPIGTAPGGAHLFHVPTVNAAADWVKARHAAQSGESR